MEILSIIFKILSLLAMYFLGYKNGIKFCEKNLNLSDGNEFFIDESENDLND